MRTDADSQLGLPVNHTKPGPKSQLEKQLRRISQLPRSEQQYVSKFLDQVLATHSQGESAVPYLGSGQAARPEC